jgi:asparagine synthase (glutamine-hydrolysing)
MNTQPQIRLSKSNHQSYELLHKVQYQNFIVTYDLGDLGWVYESDKFQVFLIGELLQYNNIGISSGIDLKEKVVKDIENDILDYKALNGHYVLLLINKLQKTIEIITNRLGTFHIYFREGYGISTSFSNLANLDLKENIDTKALSYFVKYGFFVHDTTYHKLIKVVQPATKLSFDFNFKLINKEQYYNWIYEPVQKNFEQTLNEYNKVLTEVMRDVAHGVKLNVPISGGLDSRETYALASQISNNISLFSYGLFQGNPETQIAKKLAKKRRFPIYSHVTSNYLFNRINDILRAVEGYHYLDGTRQTDVSDWLSKNGDRVLAAHWGDVWNDDMGIGDGLESVDYLLDKKFKKKGYQKALKVLGWDDNLPNPFEEQSELFLGKAAQNKDFAVKMMKTWQWSHRWTMASIRAYQLGAFPRLPYYDNRIVEFFLKTPLSHVSQRRLQIAHLKKYHPDLASVKWQEYGASLFLYKYWNNRNIFYRVVSKLWRLIFVKEFSRNWELFFLNSEGKKKLVDWSGSNNRLGKFLDDFYNLPDGGNGYALSMLLTIDKSIKFHSANKAGLIDVCRE